MSAYKPAAPRNQHSLPSIPDADIAAAFSDFAARRGSPIIADYFTAATCLPVSQREHDDALKTIRQAWVSALCGYGADALHAVAFTMREEMRARSSMGDHHAF
jgi:hypothetical protein